MDTTIKLATVLFGVVGGYPPAHWRYAGIRNGAYVLEHVRPPSQMTSYHDQFVDRETLRRLAAAV